MGTRNYSPLLLILLVILLIVSTGISPARNVQQKEQTGVVKDAGTIDNLLKAFCESLSFREGAQPDWPRFRPLFVSAAAPCVRIARNSVMQM